MQTLHTVLRGVLKMLHPLVPFVTEEIWSALPGTEGSIMVAPWPAREGVRPSAEESRAVEDLLEVIRTVRSLRSDLGLSPSDKAAVAVRAPAPRLDALRP